MDCTMEDGSSHGGRDMMEKLDDDTAMHVLSYLTSAIDVARASAVSLSWRGFVRDGRLWRRLCGNSFPAVDKFVTVRDAWPRDGDGGSPKSASHVGALRLEELIFRNLFQEMQRPPGELNCLKEALGASSTDNYPEESINETLYPRPRHNGLQQIPSYWSSKGQECSDIPETLTYKLVSRLCVVHEVYIQPFKAYFQQGSPVYSAKSVRIRLGSLREKSSDFGSDMGAMSEANRFTEADFDWAYVSPEYPMEQKDSLQSFKLQTPVLCVGGILQIELLGRVQTQQNDNLYYICVCHVMALGRPLLNFDYEAVLGSQNCILKYYGDQVLARNSSGKDLVVDAESASTSSTWPFFTERIRQLRTSSLRQNRVLLDTILGHFNVASRLLSYDGDSSSEDDENHAVDGTVLMTDGHSSEGDVSIMSALPNDTTL
eukprot:TRINITY_DN26265_c0_g1_i1.p1 TRINITY_DN26265_c0_g1~~TRINITY_DN26265_c0_g1_i1.p1  ORF type:complete len:430 (+),score=39.72 TRINITY_DN26265_c0_g1_i1:227-1516(+)